MKTCIIFNPAARGHKAKRYYRQIKKLPGTYTLKSTSQPGDGRRLAAEAVREGFEIIVASGGDGTINEVLNGIADVPGGFARTRLGIFPCGTINVFARELKLPGNINQAWQIIQRGKEREIDLCRADFGEETKQRRFFLQLAGAGLDSQAVEQVDLGLKKRIGGLSYVLAGIKMMLRKLPPIAFNDGQQSLSAEMILIGNGQLYGGNFRLFPWANHQDGLMDITIFTECTWRMLIKAGWGLLTNRLYTFGGAIHLKAKRFSLSGEGKIPLQMEGETVGYLPADFSIEPRALRVIIP